MMHLFVLSNVVYKSFSSFDVYIFYQDENPAYIMKFISKLKCSSKLWNKFSLYLKSAIQNRGHSIYLCLSKGKLFPVKMVLCATFSLGLSFDMRAFSMLNKLSVNGWRLFILCLYILSKHMPYFFQVEFIY